MLAAIAALCSAVPVQARELAIVVGIDRYRHGSATGGPDRLQDLEGAENDARLLARTLRGIGVELPPERVLIGREATADAFRRTWDALLQDARPGDGIIVTFAGHGGQEREAGLPYDESDGFDETLMFWDFSPERPSVGRIRDDELFAMLERASAQRITFVADSCHAGGLTRSLDRTLGRSRQGGTWELPETVERMPAAAKADDWESLRHVTYLTATADESKLIREILHRQRPHGALSVSFAAGISGAADRDGDGVVVRRELQDFVAARVGQLSARTQTPGFSPRSGLDNPEPLLILDREPTEIVADGPSQEESGERVASADALPISVIGGAPPEAISGVTQVAVAELQFDIAEREVVVYHGTDQIARFARFADQADQGAEPNLAPWRSMIGKFRLVNAIDATYDRAKGPVRIAVQCDVKDCNETHAEGSVLSVDVHPPISGGRHLVLFNLAGIGRVQPLYPLNDKRDPSVPTELPFEVELTARPPFGRDDLIAGFCEQRPVRLRALLADTIDAPDPAAFLRLSTEYDCQWGRYPLFTGA